MTPLVQPMTPGHTPPNRQRRTHEIVDIHWARKGETVSWFICLCGFRREVACDSVLLGHTELESAWMLHRRTP